MRIKHIIEAPVNPGDRKELDLKADPMDKQVPAPLLRLLKGIEKNCSEIMKIYHEFNSSYGYAATFMYRGASSDKDAFFGKPFDKRKAKDSNQLLSDYLNKLMAEQGFEARRDNSIFGTGDKLLAEEYANPGTYIIFPVNGFKFTWSPVEDDLVLNAARATKFFDHEKIIKVRNTILKSWNENDVGLYFPHYRNIAQFRDEGFGRNRIRDDLTSLANAIHDNALPNELLPYTNIVNFMSSEKLINHFKFNDTNLREAIESGHEIYIRSAYYAINTKFTNLVKQYFTEK